VPRNLSAELSLALLDNLPDAIVGIDRECKIRLFNLAAQETFQINADEIRGKKLWEIPVLEKNLKSLLDLVRDEKVSYQEKMLSLENEQVLLLQMFKVTAQDKTRGAIAVLRDLGQVYRIERAVNQFVANVSHELKAPLTSIKGFVETLLEGALQNGEICRKFLQVINEETNRMARLIIDLLQISSFPEKGSLLQREKLDFASLLQETIQPFEPLIKQKKLSLKFDLPPALPPLKGDRDRLMQVVINLLDNAIKFTGIKNQGEIIIAAREIPNFLQVEFKDSGIGIPENESEKIFERFYRIKEGPGASLGGTGLGLSIVKEIIEAHGGTIKVESKLGEGSSFIFNLPLSPEAE